MNARKKVNIQGDREFQALSEYITVYLKDNFIMIKNLKN
jgi:hypothetical protein